MPVLALRSVRAWAWPAAISTTSTRRAKSATISKVMPPPNREPRRLRHRNSVLARSHRRATRASIAGAIVHDHVRIEIGEFRAAVALGYHLAPIGVIEALGRF